MFLVKARKVFVVGLLVIALFGCASGKKEFQYSQQLAEADKYKEAVAYLEQAIEKEPKNKAYKKSLEALQSKVVRHYKQKVDSILADATSLTIADLNDAKSEFGKAREIAPEQPEIVEMDTLISTREDALLAQVRNDNQLAKQAMDGGDWEKAYFLLQRVQSVFPNYEDSAQNLRKTTVEGAGVYLDQAAEFFAQENFQQAQDMALKSLALDSSNERARHIFAQSQENNGADYFVQKAREATVAKDWNKAIDYYTRAQAFAPGDANIQKVISGLKMKASDSYVERAHADMANGWLLRAYVNYQQAVKYVSAQTNDYALNNFKIDLVRKMAMLADRFTEEKQYGGAWFWYQKIKEVDPMYQDIFFKIQFLEDQIKQRVQKSIAVFDFNSPSDNEDAGIIVASNLITFLFNNASGDIKILERENLKSILEEMKLGQIGVVSAQTAQEMGKVYGIDVAIMGSVLLYKIDSNDSNGIRTVRYKIGTKIEDNIDYLNWAAKHPNPNKKQLDAAPSAKIVVPQYAEKDYNVSKLRKVGFVQLSFRIVDVRTGENIQVKTVERRDSVEDESSAGLAEAQVKFDPLEIPTDTELLQQLTSEVVSELGREALDPLRSLEKKYYDEGIILLKRRQNLDAAEKFIDAVFDEKLKRVTNSPIASNAAEKINDIFMKYNTPVN